MADRVSPMTATQQGCAVITGIAGTIGLALAKAYLRRGVDVVGVDVDPQALEAAQEQLKPTGAVCSRFRSTWVTPIRSRTWLPRWSHRSVLRPCCAQTPV